MKTVLTIEKLNSQNAVSFSSSRGFFFKSHTTDKENHYNNPKFDKQGQFRFNFSSYFNLFIKVMSQLKMNGL